MRKIIAYPKSQAFLKTDFRLNKGEIIELINKLEQVYKFTDEILLNQLKERIERCKIR